MAFSHTHLPIQGLDVFLAKKKFIHVVFANQGHSIEDFCVFLVHEVTEER